MGTLKRTCETCKHSCPAYLDGTLKCFRYPSGAPRDAGTEACKHYEFAPTFLEFAAKDSLAKAREKHPGFVPIPQGWEKLEALASYYGEVARIGRRRVEDDRWEYKLGDVLLSEVYEFLEAFHHGDFNAALAEAGDVIAVLYRALNGEGKEVRNDSHAD